MELEREKKQNIIEKSSFNEKSWWEISCDDDSIDTINF